MRQDLWTETELAELRRDYADTDNAVLAARFGRTEKAISSKAKVLGLCKRSRLENYRSLTDEEIALIKAEYPLGDLEALADNLGISITNLYAKANKMGLLRDPEMVRELNRSLGKRLAASDNGHRFKKGQAPPNKGKKQTEFMSPEMIKRSIPTRFKAGQRPKNTKPVGFERVTRDGYVEVKVRDVHRLRNFELKHRLVYEQHNGPIPDGMIVEFADGDKMNFAPDNLRLVSRKENAERNRLKPRAIAKRGFGIKDNAAAEAFAAAHPELIELKRTQMQVNGKLRKVTRKPGKP